MMKWHRLLGLILTDQFTGTPFAVEMEKDLSIRQQFLDIIILRKGPGTLSMPLPDGLENLVNHNLLTYRSLDATLDDWVMDEFLGHYVNYRKLVSPSLKRLLPPEHFRLFAVTTRFPRKLSNQVKLEEKMPGVYEVRWGSRLVNIIVSSQITDQPQNAVWELFSGVPSKVEMGARQYRPRTPDISTVINDLFQQYGLEGIPVSYTVEDYRRDLARRYLSEMTPEERTEGLSPEDLLKRVSPEDLLKRVSPEDLLKRVSPEDLLKRVSPEDLLERIPTGDLEEYLRRRKEAEAAAPRRRTRRTR